MSTIELNVCPHEAGTIIEVLAQRLHGNDATLEEYNEYVTRVIKERDELQAELDGMSAGARLDSGMTAAQWRSTAMALSGEYDTWIKAIEARLNAVDTLNSIDGETVRTNLTPFINTVRGWMNSIDATINNSSQEDN